MLDVCIIYDTILKGGSKESTYGVWCIHHIDSFVCLNSKFEWLSGEEGGMMGKKKEAMQEWGVGMVMEEGRIFGSNKWKARTIECTLL